MTMASIVAGRIFYLSFRFRFSVTLPDGARGSRRRDESRRSPVRFGRFAGKTSCRGSALAVTRACDNSSPLVNQLSVNT